MDKFKNTLIIIILIAIVATIVFLNYNIINKKDNYIFVLNKSDSASYVFKMKDKIFEEVKSSDISNIMDHTSNFLTFSSILSGVIAIIITILGFLTYQHYHKTSEIRNEVRNIVNTEKVEYKKYLIEYSPKHFSFFLNKFNILVNIFAEILTNTKSKNKELINQKKRLTAECADINDTILHIQNLQSKNIDLIIKSIHFLASRVEKDYIVFIKDFHELNKSDENLKDAIRLADNVLSKYKI